jgi:hypothetical protein
MTRTCRGMLPPGPGPRLSKQSPKMFRPQKSAKDMMLDYAVEAGQRIPKPQMDTDERGFRTGAFFHPPGESAIFCMPFVSVFIRVHPWLNCRFWDDCFAVRPQWTTANHAKYADTNSSDLFCVFRVFRGLQAHQSAHGFCRRAYRIGENRISQIEDLRCLPPLKTRAAPNRGHRRHSC